MTTYCGLMLNISLTLFWNNFTVMHSWFSCEFFLFIVVYL